MVWVREAIPGLSIGAPHGVPSVSRRTQHNQCKHETFNIRQQLHQRCGILWNCGHNVTYCYLVRCVVAADGQYLDVGADIITVTSSHRLLCSRFRAVSLSIHITHNSRYLDISQYLTVRAGLRHAAVGLNVVLLGDHSLEGLGHLLGLELAAQLHRGRYITQPGHCCCSPLRTPRRRASSGPPRCCRGSWPCPGLSCRSCRALASPAPE